MSSRCSAIRNTKRIKLLPRPPTPIKPTLIRSLAPMTRLAAGRAALALEAIAAAELTPTVLVTNSRRFTPFFPDIAGTPFGAILAEPILCRLRNLTSLGVVHRRPCFRSGNRKAAPDCTEAVLPLLRNFPGRLGPVNTNLQECFIIGHGDHRGAVPPYRACPAAPAR